MTRQAEKHAFQAEVNEVLSIVVNSLYSHREVFLRELISNASDALDQLSFRALTDHDLMGEDTELRIELIPDPGAGTLTVRDNGIGMTHDELVENLGTIARSGTKRLMQSLKPEQKKDLSLIGQFGVGFYAAFLVADRVTVTSRAASSTEAWQWESEAKGDFELRPAEREGRGTDVVLHLKDDAKEFLEEWTLRNLVRKYSDYVRYPIRLRVVRTEKEGAPVEWVDLNEARALWTRPRHEITDEQYREFYKHLSHDWEPPLAWTHFKVEGVQELTGLLFIPRHAPFDLLERKHRGVRLYVKRVFITDDAEELMPEWLRFVRGVIDSEDLPLNVSREVLQKDATTRFIRKQVIHKTLALLEELADEGEIEIEEDGEKKKVDRYALFWRQFGRILKEGIHFEPAQRERIAKLLRYESTRGEGLTSLAAYVARMKQDQKAIYYVIGQDLATARSSPHIEGLLQRGYEVLLMTDPIDEWVVAALGEFDGKPLVSAAKGSLDLAGENDEAKAEREKKAGELGQLLTGIKAALADRVADVRLTDRLTDSPACLVADEHGLTPHMEQILRASGQEVPRQKRILELNPDHPVVARLRALAESDGERLGEWSEMLYDQALLAEGILPDDAATFARRIARLMAEAPADGK